MILFYVNILYLYSLDIKFIMYKLFRLKFTITRDIMSFNFNLKLWTSVHL